MKSTSIMLSRTFFYYLKMMEKVQLLVFLEIDDIQGFVRMSRICPIEIY